jgi:hypothetical protein
MTSFVFSILSPTSSDDVANVPRPWYAPRRSPQLSFPLVSTIKSLIQGEAAEIPMQVNLHVEIERDFQTKSVMQHSDSESEFGVGVYGPLREGVGLEKIQEPSRDGKGNDVAALPEMMNSKI